MIIINYGFTRYASVVLRYGSGKLLQVFTPLYFNCDSHSVTSFKVDENPTIVPSIRQT